MTIVADASAVVAALVSSEAGPSLRRRLADHDVVAAPHLIDLEVASALRRIRRHLGEDRTLRALEDFRLLRIARYPHEPLLGDVWALRNELSAYDAAYVALARAMNVALLTLDQRLATVAADHVAVETV